MFDSGLLHYQVAEMDQVLTPKQQCLYSSFSDSPSTKLLPKSHHCVSDVDNTLDSGLLLKAKRPIRDLTTERESRSNIGPSDILD